jgi:hypothetical protein
MLETMATVSAIADLVHTLPHLHPVHRDDLEFVVPHLRVLGLETSAVAGALSGP